MDHVLYAAKVKATGTHPLFLSMCKDKVLHGLYFESTWSFGESSLLTILRDFEQGQYECLGMWQYAGKFELPSAVQHRLLGEPIARGLNFLI